MFQLFCIFGAETIKIVLLTPFFCVPILGPQSVVLALWTPKLPVSITSYIILLTGFIKVCLWHNYTIRKMFIIIFRFRRFMGVVPEERNF